MTRLKRNSMKTIRETSHVASKEHKCMFCNSIIKKGQRYNRQTNVYDGSIYDWICHEECDKVALLLDMIDSCEDEGINDEHFLYCIEDYVYDNHYDKETDDISNEWQVPLYDQVKMIIEELKNK